MNSYYDAIKDIFQDGDIIVGYSLGCIYAVLLMEKLEKDNFVGESILIDGELIFVFEEKLDVDLKENDERDDLEEIYSGEFVDKYNKIIEANSTWNFPVPKITSHIIYLSTKDQFNEDLDNISDNYELIYIDSDYRAIINKDIDKIVKYFK